MTMLLLLLGWFQAFAGALTVEVLDVGQGDAILIRSPAGKTVLIDAGTSRSPVPVMLKRRDIDTLDLVIATHAHADHIGAMARVLQQVPVKLYGDQGMPHTTTTYARVMQQVEGKGIRYLALRSGRVFNLDDGIKLEVLGPAEPLLGGTRSDLNSNSVVTRLTHGDNCFLFTGDAEDPTEHLLLQNGLSTCNVLKVAHHGSAHSTSRAWLQAVQPELALISVGEGNRYGHPDDGTLLRLERNGARILRTDLLGTIKVVSDKKSLVIEEVDERALVAAWREDARVSRAAASGAAASANAAEPAGVEAVALRPLPSEQLPAPVLRAVLRDGGQVSSDGFIDINTATIEQLMTVPGIGPARAQAIIAFRDANGPFATLEALDAVPGIGPATLARLAQHLRFPSPEDPP